MPLRISKVLDRLLLKMFKYLPPEYIMFTYSRSLVLKVYSFISLLSHIILKIINRKCADAEAKIPLQQEIISKIKWRTMIVLDAMRYDVFRKYIISLRDLKRKRLKVILLPALSPASNTPQWYRIYRDLFADLSYNEGLILITFNPVPYIEGIHKLFSKTYNIWKSAWNEEMNAIPLDLAFKEIMHIIFRYKIKGYRGRFLIHILYPHAPYLVNKSSYTIQDFLRTTNSIKRFRMVIWKAYTLNVLKSLILLNKLITLMPKPIVVTADHGELLGEYNLYLHPGGLRIPLLRLVPLLIVTDDTKELISIHLLLKNLLKGRK